LIKKGADVNAVDGEGNSALALASEQGHTAVIDFLKRNGAKPVETAPAGTSEKKEQVPAGKSEKK
jgi:ankyrin repeat protein